MTEVAMLHRVSVEFWIWSALVFDAALAAAICLHPVSAG